MARDREPSNQLRIDLYRRLLPEIQREDQKSGAHGPVFHWNDPAAMWDELRGDPRALEAVWDSIGLSPLYQQLFYSLEQMEGEDLAVLESLDALIDPVTCPESRLADIAASFGYRLAEGVSEARKRAALLGLIDAYKGRGTGPWSFKVFYRLIGLEIVNIFPLWKTAVFEDAEDYSRFRYQTTSVVGAPVGPAGQTVFVGQLADAPIKPGSLRFVDMGVGGVVVRDEGDRLLGPSGDAGSINLRTGEFALNLGAPAIGAVVANLQKITKEWPYHAARIDVDILLSPGGAPIPLITPESVTDILLRMEEVRPIHVLLRALALVAEIRDEFGADGASGATDRTACTQIRKDLRDGLLFPGPQGRDFTYMIDDGGRAEDEFRVEITPLVGTPSLEHIFEDNAPVVCPLDRLVIVAGGPPSFW